MGFRGERAVGKTFPRIGKRRATLRTCQATWRELFSLSLLGMKVSTFGIHKLAWLMVSKRFPWNAKYETVYRWFASYIVIYTIMELKS